MQRAPMMIGVLWMFQGIAFILVGLRLYTRLVVMSNYGWDDHFFNAAVVSILPRVLHAIRTIFATSTFLVMKASFREARIKSRNRIQ